MCTAVSAELWGVGCWSAAEIDWTLCLLPFPLCKTLAGLEKNFNQWDPLINGEDENLIPGTNVNLLQSAIWTGSVPLILWPLAFALCAGVSAKGLKCQVRPTWHFLSTFYKLEIIFKAVIRWKSNLYLIKGWIYFFWMDQALSVVFVSAGLNVAYEQLETFFSLLVTSLLLAAISWTNLCNQFFSFSVNKSKCFFCTSLDLWAKTRYSDCCVIM